MPGEFPRRGEIVIGVVRKINPFSIFLDLEEYPGKEGMIHISEVAGKWVKDIRSFAKVGQKKIALVIRIDQEKNLILLSLKKVRKYEAENKMKEYKRNIKAEKMLELISKREKISLEELNQGIVEKLREEFGDLFKAFQLSMTPSGQELMKKRGISDRWIKVFSEIASSSMELKEKPIKGIMEISCTSYEGIETIKKILMETQEKFTVKIRYISAPKYSIELKTKDPKVGEKKLKEAADYIIQSIEKFGGTGKFERLDE